MPIKKKYNSRFPTNRIKKIMQTDEEVGKMAQAVPVIISRTLELFIASLLKKTLKVSVMQNATMLRPNHLKKCILSEGRFDFLKDLVKDIPDVSSADDDASDSITEGNMNERRVSSDAAMEEENQSSDETESDESDT